MLKISDYLSMMLAFVALAALFLILSGEPTAGEYRYYDLPELELPEGYSAVREYQTDDPAFAVICGTRAESETTRSVIEMITDLKRTYNVFTTVDRIGDDQLDGISVIVVTAGGWNEIGDGDRLLEYAGREGKSVIFAGIPEDRSGAYNKTIGVMRDAGPAEIDGIMLLDGLLIEGMVYYKDLKMTVSDVVTDSRCRKWAIEYAEEAGASDLIPLIWQKHYGNGSFFVVNGDLLASPESVGILSGILARTEEAFVYPVVNAKAVLLDSFPELNNPYEEEIQALYSRDTNMFIRDILWPSVVKVGELHTLTLSVRTKRPLREGDWSNYNTLADLIQRRDYEISSDPDDAAWTLPYAASGHWLEEAKVLDMQSSISGAGLATFYLDLWEVMGENADDTDYEWSAYSLELAKTFNDLYRDADWIDSLKASQAWERYKRYTLLRPDIETTDSEIAIRTGEFHDVCYYMVRTEKEVLSGDGYRVTPVGEDAYLITAFTENVVVGLKDKT